MIAGSQTIADDRRRSQKIEHGSIFCDRLRSRSQDRRRSQTIAEVGFHMIADDRRTFCDSRSSAIIWKPALNESIEGWAPLTVISPISGQQGTTVINIGHLDERNYVFQQFS